jgi:AAA15 family ATPase/GTPase
MIHISNLYVQNFCGIQNLNFSPRDINIIVGKNNSGKSTILKAIRKNLYPTPSLPPYFFFGGPRLNNYVKIGEKVAKIESNVNTIYIYEQYDNLPEDIKVSVDDIIAHRLKKIENRLKCKSEIVLNIYNFFLNKHTIVTIVDNNNIIVYPVFIGESNTLLEFFNQLDNYQKELLPKNFKGSTSNIFSEELLKNDKINTKLNYIFLDTSNNNKNNVFSDEIKILKVEEFIKKNKLIPNFYRLTNESVIYQKENDEKYSLSYSSHGSGFLSLLKIFLAIEESKNGILLLEEPENHLHPGYLSILVEVLFKQVRIKNIQIFITTHSYDLLQEIIEYPKTKKSKESVLISLLSKDSISTDIYYYSIDEAKYEIDTLKMDLRGI